MASTPIKAERFAILDGLGFEQIARLYLERHRTVRSLVRAIFPPREENETPGVGDFYAWLRARGLEDDWREIVRLRAGLAADEAVETAMSTTPSTVAADRLKSETLRWQAKVCDPGTFGERLGVNVAGSLGVEWATALQAALAPDAVLEADVIDEEDLPELPPGSQS